MSSVTRYDFFCKWALYAIALIPAHILEFVVFSRFPLFGATPLLLVVSALCVALLEGPAGGAGFGLFTALVWSASTPGDSGGIFVVLTFLCFFVGLASIRFLRQNFLGALLCSAVGLGVWEGLHIAVRLFSRVSSPAPLLRIALPEFLVSLAFLVVLYPLFRAVYQKVGGEKLANS